MDIEEIFENRIKPLILEKQAENVDDTEMERAMGLPAHSIYKWLKKGYKSYTKYIPQIAAYFHVSVDYLTGASDVKTPIAKDDRRSAFDNAVLDFIHSLPYEQLRGILVALKAPQELLDALDREALEG